MDKVNELVEWVAKRICTLNHYINEWEELHPSTQEAWRNEAKQILSHPDLALIDRERNKERYLVHRVAVIPLSSAIKQLEVEK